MILPEISTGKIFETVFVSFFLCLMIVPIAIRFSHKTNLIDFPLSEPHKIHKRPVPISGGLAFFATLILTAVFLNHRLDSQTGKVLLCATIIFGFALWDDYRPLRWRWKMLGQILAAIVLYFCGIQVQIMQTVGEILGFSAAVNDLLDFGITIFWMVFITNAFNLVDSMDGLMVGLSLLALIFFVLAAMDTKQWSLALLCSAMLGACIVLNFFNSSPAILFFGDSGAQTIGFLIAAIAIIYNPPDRLQTSTWFMPILLLGVPIFDTVLVIISRFRRHLHFYDSGTDHTYHRLVKMGFSDVQAVNLMLLAATALEILAFFIISRPPLTANLIFFAVVLAGIFLIYFLESENMWESIRLKKNGD